MVKASILFGWVSAILLFSTTASSQTPEDLQKAREAFELASAYFEGEEYDAALPLFEKAYELSGKRPSTVFALAQCERAMGLYDQAIVHFSEYLASHPENAQEVGRTLKLLKAQKRQRDKDAEEERKRKAAAEEEQKQREAQARLEEEKRIEEAARRAAELSRQDAQTAPPPPPLTQTNVTTDAPDDGGGLLSSPWFWILTTVAVAGAATTVAVVASSGSEPYEGSSGILLKY